MTPEEVLLEAISVTSLQGDSIQLRHNFCVKLQESLERCELYNVRWNALMGQRREPYEV